MKIPLTLSLFTLCTFTAQEAMQPANRLEQHEWLQQLVGEWKVSGEAIMEPGGDPTTWESKESTRSIGGLWIVAEGTADRRTYRARAKPAGHHVYRQPWDTRPRVS